MDRVHATATTRPPVPKWVGDGGTSASLRRPAHRGLDSDSLFIANDKETTFLFLYEYIIDDGSPRFYSSAACVWAPERSVHGLPAHRTPGRPGRLRVYGCAPAHDGDECPSHCAVCSAVSTTGGGYE
eukprot:scaffold5363_cov109-Isochrysis_galbana.AAC.1